MTLWWLVGLPAVVGVVLSIAGASGRDVVVERAAMPVAVVTGVVVAVLAGVAAATRPEVSLPFLAGAPLGLAVDGLSAAVVVMVAAVALLVLVFAGGDVRESRARFAGLMLLFVAAVMVTATATTLVALLLAWEVMGATSYALIGFWWREEERVASGATAFLVTRAGDLGLYLAVAAGLAGGAGFALADLSDASPGWRHVIAAGILVSALGKAAQLPFSFWLSRAMVGPSPVSALLHSAAMVAMGGYLLLRTSPLLQSTGWAGPTTAWIGALTAVGLGVVALAQRDLKQLLAASTAAQLGFVVLAAGLGAVAGGTAHLVAHAATKALLFLVAGAWLSALGTKQLPALVGAARRWPVVGVGAAVGALALAGLPPLSLWATKDEVLAAAREASLPLYLVGLVGAALSAGYAGKILVIVWRRAPEGVEQRFDDEQQGTRHVGLAEKGPLVVLALGAAVLGVLALPPVGEHLAALVGDTSSPTAGVGELALSASLAVAALALAWRFASAETTWARRPLGAWFAGWLGLEETTHVLVVRPTLRVAELLARFDDRVLDRGVDGAATATVRAAQALSVADDRVVDGAVLGTATATLTAARASAGVDDLVVDGAVNGVARGARRLGSLARRPQTGLLHQYYLQAVVVLAIAVAVLVAPLVVSVIDAALSTGT